MHNAQISLDTIARTVGVLDGHILYSFNSIFIFITTVVLD